MHQAVRPIEIKVMEYDSNKQADNQIDNTVVAYGVVYSGKAGLICGMQSKAYQRENDYRTH